MLHTLRKHICNVHVMEKDEIQLKKSGCKHRTNIRLFLQIFVLSKCLQPDFFNWISTFSSAFRWRFICSTTFTRHLCAFKSISGEFSLYKFIKCKHYKYVFVKYATFFSFGSWFNNNVTVLLLFDKYMFHFFLFPSSILRERWVEWPISSSFPLFVISYLSPTPHSVDLEKFQVAYSTLFAAINFLNMTCLL